MSTIVNGKRYTTHTGVNVTDGFSVNGVAVAASTFAAAKVTTAGGAAAEAITVTGALSTDVPVVTMIDDGTSNVTIVSSAVTADTLTVTFSADPGTDTIISYVLYR